MYFRRFKKNAEALSPVVASIILVAVTVAVSVVVAGWLGGMSTSLMNRAEQASINNAQYVNSTSVRINIQNTGSTTVTISGATIDGNSVNFSGTNSQGQSSNLIVKGTMSEFTLQQASQFINTAVYTIKLQTARGNTITYSYTYIGS